MRGGGPGLQPGLERVEGGGAPGSPILVGKVAVPALPGRIGGGPRLAYERQIGDREGVPAAIACTRPAVAVAEGVELLDIAEGLAGLALDFIRFPRDVASITGTLPPDVVDTLGLIQGPVAAAIGVTAALLLLGYRIDRTALARIQTTLAERSRGPT